jgi:hypothetical protein
MLKKHLIAASACLIAFSTGLFAEETKTPGSMTDRPVSLELYTTITSYYKIQNNYRTPLDGNDRFITDANANSDAASTYASETDAGGKNRHGANNRADQNSRTIGDLSIVGRAGAMKTDGIDWYKMIGVVQIQIDANDPDHPDNVDGDRKARVRHRDAWVRYAPILPLGIKVGTQTLPATATAAAIGHQYAGDQDNDFIYYTAATLLEVPGISVDMHLSKDIELGVGSFEGMGDASMIATGGKTSQARNTATWFSGKFGLVDATLAYQSIAVGETEDDSATGIQGVYQHEYKHTVLNFAALFHFGNFSPYLSYQSIQGDKVKNPLVSGTVNSSVSAFGEALEVQEDESREIDGQFIGVGLIADIGPGELAFDYTKGMTPTYGEKGTAPALIEMDYAMQLNYTYPIAEGAAITAFYNHMQAKEDKKLRDDIQHMKNNVAIAKTGVVSEDSIRTLERYATLLESYRMTSTTSYGVSFEIKFGN